MCHSNGGRFRQQVKFLRCQYLQVGRLPFADVLSEETIRQALTASGVSWNDRIYTPLVTLWVFLSQVLCADHSCRAAVARLIAHRASLRQRPCSPETGAYCRARKRLPEKFFADVTLQTGRALDSTADRQWLWKQRRVYTFDGSVVSMPDTPENQQAYPQPPAQKPGLGFPIARIAAVFSLSCGAVVDLGICRYAGKGQGEITILRSLWGMFAPGDVLLTDRLMCSWTELLQLKQLGIDSVTRLSKRKADFRRGKRLGSGDHIVNWKKPTKPRTAERALYKQLPDFLTVREVRVRVDQKGFRSRSLVVVTTLLNHEEVTASDLAELYRARWNAELDLRCLKHTLQMNALRCRTPELVRKEIWTHLLAYNLIRAIVAQAAVAQSVDPRTISFKGAVQTLKAFQPIIATQGQRDSKTLLRLYQKLLEAIATHRVADRPDRFEPRRIKRRNGKYDLLSRPRHEMKRELLKAVRKK